MLISRVRLRPDAADRFRDRAPDPYHQHTLIWDLFADVPDRKRDFIYRSEMVQGLPAFYCVSGRVPEDRHAIWLVESKPYAPVVNAGEVFSFVVRVNPIRAKRDDGHRQHRHDVVMEYKTRLKETGGVLPQNGDIVQEAGFRWLAQKGEANGFSIRAEDIRASDYLPRRFKNSRRDHEIRISTLDLTGFLTVTDPDPFVRALLYGIGPAKGFGCGMLMIRRAQKRVFARGERTEKSNMPQR